MKRLLLILILTFSFQTLTKADDISDFEIEGISIGDSALDYMTLSEIKKAKDNKKNIYYTNKSYVSIMVSTKIYNNLKTYDDLSLIIKTKDKQSIIYAMEGYIKIKDSKITTCHKKQQIIANDIKEAFPNLKLDQNKFDIKKSDLKYNDKSVRYVDMKLPLSLSSGGSLRVSCHKVKASKNNTKLFVIINSNEFNKALRKNN